MKKSIYWLAAVVLSFSSTSLFAQPSVKLTDPWARATVAGQQAGGAFITLQSQQNDVLLEASSPVSRSMEIHEMRMEDNIMRMREIPQLALPAGQAVELKPGGYHLMFQGLHQALQPGTDVEVTLIFQEAGKQTLRFPVKALNSAAGQHHSHGHGHGHPAAHH